jgi:hypothetical protein
MTRRRFATGKHGDWYADCRDGKRRAVCHFRKVIGTSYIDKSERIPPSQEWFEFFEYIKQTKEVIFQITDDPTTDRRLGYIEYVFEAYDVKYDEALMTHSFKFHKPRKI